MRISDWSSDVCSSDLLDIERALGDVHAARQDARLRLVDRAVGAGGGDVHLLVAVGGLRPGATGGNACQCGEERQCASGGSGPRFWRPAQGAWREWMPGRAARTCPAWCRRGGWV